MKSSYCKRYLAKLFDTLEYQVKQCISLGLRCIDPPIATSGLLKQCGMSSDYKLFKFWKCVETVIGRGVEVPLYRMGKNVYFAIRIEHCVGSAWYSPKLGAYLDPLDCKSIDDCIEVTNAHEVKAYIVGRVGGAELKVNLVFALKKLCEASSSCCMKLFELAKAVFSGNEVDVSALNCLIEVCRRFSWLLEPILVAIPNSLEELKKRCPLLRRRAVRSR